MSGKGPWYVALFGMLSLPVAAFGGYYGSEVSDLVTGVAHVTLSSSNLIVQNGCSFYDGATANGSADTETACFFDNAVMKLNPSWSVVGGHSYAGSGPSGLKAHASGQYRDASTTQCVLGTLVSQRFSTTSARSVGASCGVLSTYVGMSVTSQTTCTQPAADTRDGTMFLSFSFGHEAGVVTSSQYKSYSDTSALQWDIGAGTNSRYYGNSCYTVWWHP